MDGEAVDEFGAGGARLFEALSSGADSPATAALIVEAARTKDRLDKLHRITSGDSDTWTRIFTGEGEVVLKLDTAVSEQRQLSTVFRQLLAEIQRRQSGGSAPRGEDGLADL